MFREHEATWAWLLESESDVNGVEKNTASKHVEYLLDTKE